MEHLSKECMEKLLNLFRAAVCRQIVVWDAAQLIIEILEREDLDALPGIMRKAESTSIEDCLTYLDLYAFLKEVGGFRRNIPRPTRKALLEQFRISVCAEIELGNIKRSMAQVLNWDATRISRRYGCGVSSHTSAGSFRRLGLTSKVKLEQALGWILLRLIFLNYWTSSQEAG